MKKSDYEQSIEYVKNLPKIYLGQEVKTEIGKGIVVGMEMDYNGLFIYSDTAKCVVWFSTSDSKDGWISKSFKISEVNPNYRKEKLLKINESTSRG